MIHYYVTLGGALISLGLAVMTFYKYFRATEGSVKEAQFRAVCSVFIITAAVFYTWHLLVLIANG